MKARWHVPLGAASAALLAMTMTAGCTGGDGGDATDRGATPTAPSESGGLAEPVAPAGSPTFCTELTEQDALVGLAGALAGDPDRVTDAVLAAADELDSLAPPDSLDAALIAGTVESLRTWAGDPGDEAATNSMSDALEALGEEVQELCAFPVG